MTTENDSHPAARRSTRWWLWAGLVTCTTGFVLLALLMVFAVTDPLDNAVMSLIRSARADALDGAAEGWLAPFLRDVTALGSVALLSLFTIVVTGFLLLKAHRRWPIAGGLLIVSGMLANNLLKMLFSRSRPDLVPHETTVFTSSFPSGHAMMSALVYPLLVLLLSRRMDRTACCLLYGFALLIIANVGWSRVYLGVHWPSDIVAGWLAGFAWACGAALVLTSGRFRGAAAA